MVQFVFTPWRDRAELLRVRAQLYPRLAPGSDGKDDKKDKAGEANVTTATGGSSSDSTAEIASGGISPPSRWWSSPEELREAERAVARVLMWVHRGGCPHVVESTALLMSAMIFDARGGHDAVAGAAVAAGYLVGFTRFVTGLLDGYQDKARKLSMYGVAKTIGLPAAFVELRHQGTHEPMPSLAQLRPAAARALVWIWEYYWKNLLPDEEPRTTRQGAEVIIGSIKGTDGQGGEASSRAAGGAPGGGAAMRSALEERMCRMALLGYLQRQPGASGEDSSRESLMKQLERWDDVLVVKTLAEIGGAAGDRGVLSRSVKLAWTVLGQSLEEIEGTGEEEDMEALRLKLFRARDELLEREGTGVGKAKGTGKRKKGQADENDEFHGDESAKRGGWYKWKGQWSARPIGVL